MDNWNEKWWTSMMEDESEDQPPKPSMADPRTETAIYAEHQAPHIAAYNAIKDVFHGVFGHIGYRCRQCAYLSLETNSIAGDSGEYWQNKQIDWQEDCDTIMAEFDQAVMDHFPVHLPVNCQTCPIRGELPAKPMPPIERSMGKLDSKG